MKKSLLVLVLIAVFCQAKAQQLFQPKPADSLKNTLLQKYLNITPGSQPQLFQLKTTPLENMASVNTVVKASNYYHMPIAFLQGYSKMPVVKPGGKDKMPVAKLGGPDVITIDPKKVTP